MSSCILPYKIMQDAFYLWKLTGHLVTTGKELYKSSANPPVVFCGQVHGTPKWLLKCCLNISLTKDKKTGTDNTIHEKYSFYINHALPPVFHISIQFQLTQGSSFQITQAPFIWYISLHDLYHFPYDHQYSIFPIIFLLSRSNLPLLHAWHTMLNNFTKCFTTWCIHYMHFYYPSKHIM